TSCQTAESAPRTNNSRFPAVCFTTVGLPLTDPPSDCHLPHVNCGPVWAICQRAPSVPAANTSRPPLALDATAGSLTITPPRLIHADQVPVAGRCELIRRVLF